MKRSFFKQTYFWYGIYYGLGYFLLFLICYFLVPQLLSDKIASTFIFIFPMVLCMTLAGIAEKKAQNGYLSYGNTFKTMFLTAFIGILIFTLFSHFFTTYYDPEYMTAIFEKEMAETRLKLEESGKSDEDIDKVMKMTESIYKMKDNVLFKLVGVFFLAVMAAMLALLNALFIKRTPPEIMVEEKPLDQSN